MLCKSIQYKSKRKTVKIKEKSRKCKLFKNIYIKYKVTTKKLQNHYKL
nr:MAG TPA: hypothetical protein [Caudoviricetes sp.]